jgi:hypothetical protein
MIVKKPGPSKIPLRGGEPGFENRGVRSQENPLGKEHRAKGID